MKPCNEAAILAETNTSKIVHDIRNPLNTISMNAELGKLILQKNQDIDKTVAIFNIIINECQKCSLALSELKIQITETQ